MMNSQKTESTTNQSDSKASTADGSNGLIAKKVVAKEGAADKPRKGRGANPAAAKKRQASVLRKSATDAARPPGRQRGTDTRVRSASSKGDADDKPKPDLKYPGLANKVLDGLFKPRSEK